jgi:hypothetical protein
MVDRIVRILIGIILLYAVATGKVQGIVMNLGRDTWSEDAGYCGI